MLGCGSTEVITMLVNWWPVPGDEIVYPWRSFEAYPLIVAGRRRHQRAGAEPAGRLA